MFVHLSTCYQVISSLFCLHQDSKLHMALPTSTLPMHVYEEYAAIHMRVLVGHKLTHINMLQAYRAT